MLNPEVVAFEATAVTPCLILLGEPGIGKSHALEAERENIRKFEAQGDYVIWLDLHSYGSEERLIANLFGHEAFQASLQDKNKLYIFLDSLDEGLLRIETLASLLVDEFAKYPIEHINLRIACRTAEWPSILEIGLKRLWGSEAVKAYELAPLRKADVTAAIEAHGRDSNAFLDEIARKEVVPFAIKPVTLKFLINTYLKNGSFPSSQKELYLEGCRLLCEETNKNRIASGRAGSFSVEQRLITAARIAAITIFSSRYVIWTDTDYGNVPDEDVTIRDLGTGTETTEGNEFSVNKPVIEETLATGLFSARSINRLGWAHQTYAEFLAAWYVTKHELTLSQIKSLIFHPGNPDGKLVPQLHETSAWLASMMPEVFRMIMDSDPQVLLRSDVSSVPAPDREKLVESLLRLYEEEKLLDDDLDTRRKYKKLVHPRLDAQLRPYIRDCAKPRLVRRVAADIAEAAELRTLQDDLAEVALDVNDLLSVRINAAYAVKRIGDETTKARLKPLAFGQAGEDPEDELKGCGLDAVWPNHISSEELFSLLTPPKRTSLIGAYKMFLSSTIVEHLTVADLPTALNWVKEYAGYNEWHVFDHLKEAILHKALNSIGAQGIGPALAAAFISILSNHDLELGNLVDDNEKRHQLLDQLLPLLVENGNDWVWLTASHPSYVRSQDIAWLINRLEIVKSSSEMELIARLIESVFDYRETDQTDAIIMASQTNSILANAFKRFLNPVTLNSPEAEQMKSHYQEMKSRQERKKRPLLDPPPETRIGLLLNRCESGELSAWWQLTMELSLEPDSTHYVSEWESNLTSLPGWNSANESTKARILNVAKKYVVEGNPETDKWLGTGSFYYVALGGFRALRLLLQKTPQFLESISKESWQKWAPIVLVYEEMDSPENDVMHQRLLKLAYDFAPNGVIETLMFIIDRNEYGFSQLFKKLEHCWDERLSQTLLSKLQDKNLNAGRIATILGVLIRHDVEQARTLAKTLISHPLSSSDDRSLAVKASCLLLNYAPDAGWNTVWFAIQRDAEFGREVCSRMADGTDSGRSLVGRITADQLADLYIWLARQYPHNEDPNYGEAHFVGTRENIARWRDSILAILREMGTDESCNAIRHIADELPELNWLNQALINAQNVTRRKTWRPSQPEDLIKMMSNQRLRLVRSGEDLLDILIEALKRLEAKLQGETPAAIDLWGPIPGKNNCYRPKDENHFSDYVKRFLDDYLKHKGVVVNREVEVRRSMGGNPGERLDIRVDAVIKDASGKVYDSVNAIIEIKGSWHAELNSAMQTQLVDRYLKDNDCRSGLYVVGWFNCAQWDIEDGRQKHSPKIGIPDAQAQFDYQAASLSSKYGLNVRTLVINAALR